MSKVCPKHETEMTAKVLDGVMNYFCADCGQETFRGFFPSSDPVAQRNARVQSRYDELMRVGKHGHYETLFQVVREEVERATANQP